MAPLRFSFDTFPETPWMGYFNYLYSSFINYCNQFCAFYVILLSHWFTRLVVMNHQVWSLIRKDGSLEDFHLASNVLVISTSLILVYLWCTSSDKVINAYYTIMAVSLVHFGVDLLIQLRQPLLKRTTRSLVRLVSNPRFRMEEKPILSFLKKDHTGMFVFTCVMIDSKVNYCKAGLLFYYAVLKLVETYSSRKHPLVNVAYFGLGILENVILVVFWYESCKMLQFNKAICYTLMYLLRLEESGSTNKSVKGLMAVVKFCYRRFNHIEVNKPQTSEIRSLSLQFDCYSIISDAK